MTVYAAKVAVTTQRQQTGDEAEENRNTIGIFVRCLDDNTVRVNNLIFV